jgi:REP element-mobilizing transposase RayT
MPRQSRQGSSSEIFHVLLRGINQQRIFEDSEDYRYYLSKLATIVQETDIALLAYCLMPNHVHILLKENEASMAHCFKRLGSSYAYYFNKKYGRSGHLFQDRFKSEAVEDDAYFFSVLNYIYQNPVKAGIAQSVDRYQWSSFCVLGKKSLVIDKDALFALVPEKEIRLLVKQPSTAEPFERKMRGRPRRFSDEEAMELMEEVCGAHLSARFQMLSDSQQEKAVQELGRKDVSIRQLARITGLGKGLVERWVKGLSKT